MNLNQLAKDIHKNSVEHGWWDEPRSFGDIVALCHSELSEALEEYRNGMPDIYYRCKVNIEEGYEGKETIADGSKDCNIPCEECSDRCAKPEGIAVELADCIIRILDFCGKEGIDIDSIVRIKHEYNKSRPYRHGGKVI